MRNKSSTEKNQNTESDFRKFQLLLLGLISISIGPAVLFFTMIVHDLPMLNSISESGTIPNAVSPILPFALGALALFALSYSLKYAYANHKEALAKMREMNKIMRIKG
ncbi:MAG: hypothetical protein LBD23_02525 [Oscillospiraceae bacterium]|jgi:hypothetical protein|nr:hypothetical protein [Oscillospiraceae bacterium]